MACCIGRHCYTSPFRLIDLALLINTIFLLDASDMFIMLLFTFSMYNTHLRF